MIKWEMDEAKLEGRAEIYLEWKNLIIISTTFIIAFVIALFFNSIFIKAICWFFVFLGYVSTLRVQGPCIMAIAVILLPWYVFIEIDMIPYWLIIIPILITIIEIDYIIFRMKFIKKIREKEGIIV